MNMQSFAQQLHINSASLQSEETSHALTAFNMSIGDSVFNLIDALSCDAIGALLDDLFHIDTGRRRSLTAFEAEFLLNAPFNLIDVWADVIDTEQEAFLLAALKEYQANKCNK